MIDGQDDDDTQLVQRKEILTLSQKNFDSTDLHDLRTMLFNAITEVNKCKRVIISQRDALEKAKLESMNKSELEIWFNYSDTVSQIKHLSVFKKC